MGAVPANLGVVDSMHGRRVPDARKSPCSPANLCPGCGPFPTSCDSDHVLFGRPFLGGRKTGPGLATGGRSNGTQPRRSRIEDISSFVPSELENRGLVPVARWETHINQRTRGHWL